MRTLVLVACVLAARTASAESAIELMLNQQGQDLAQEIGLDVPAFVEQSRQRIDELYRLSRTGELLSAFANVAAFAQRGVGVDYDPDPRDILFGATATGFQGDIAIGDSASSFAGSSINAAAMVGVNLGRWNHPRWTVYANGFYLDTTVRSLGGNLLTLGAHAQVRVVEPRAPGPARWMGVVVTTGLEYASWVVGNAQELDVHFSVMGSLESKGVHMFSNGTLEVDVQTVGVPVEVSTAVRLGNVVTPYAGAGLELATGSSDVTIALDSVLTVNDERTPIGTARITGSDSRAPDAIKVHAFAGLQFHTRHVRIAAQTAVQDGAFSVALGVRGAL